MGKKIVEVKVKADVDGEYSYVSGGRYVSFGCNCHSQDDAKESLKKDYLSFTAKHLSEAGLDTAPTIHTYEVEVDDE